MILLFYIVLNVIVIVLFTKKKKNLHSLEILVYWCVSTYLFQNFSAVCYMNFKTIYIPDKLTLELSHFVNRIILYPILMVTFLHYFLLLSSLLKKLLLIICSIFLLAGLEWFADYLGVVNHINWPIWWSFAYWLTSLLFLIGFMKLFRKILYKGGLKL